MKRAPGTAQEPLSASQALIISLLLGLVGVAQGCMPAAIGANEKLVADRIASNPEIRSLSVPSADFDLYFRSAGAAKEVQLLWIHGTPGGWSDIAGLMVDDSFLERGRIISIDRPGWGLSQSRGQQRMATTFEEHSTLLQPLLEQLHDEYPEVPLIAAGHSWGSPMAAYLGARHPDLVDGVVALAGPFDPSLKILRWYNHAGRLPGVRTLIGSTLRRSNIEMFLLPGEVQAAQEVWQTLKRPLLIIHGKDDTLVPIAHVDYAARLFANTQTHILKLDDQGHLLQFEQPALIGRCALALARQDMSACLGR
ncbi:MAG: alpha/beta hydrolase [Pseudomonadota bacterium]